MKWFQLKKGKEAAESRLQLLAAHRGAEPLTPEAFQEWRARQNKTVNIQEGPWWWGVMGTKHRIPIHGFPPLPQTQAVYKLYANVFTLYFISVGVHSAVRSYVNMSVA